MNAVTFGFSVHQRREIGVAAGLAVYYVFQRLAFE
jgi:hypothetical protein